jgi:putative heme iron utilization protein
MSYSAYVQNASLYFYRTGPDESFEAIANKFNVSATKIVMETGSTHPKEGTLVVINFKSGTLTV